VKIDGALAVVTGASGGIGEATARALALAGAEVVLLARDKVRLASVRAAIQADGRKSHIYAVDLSDPQATTRAGQNILLDHGVPDILVNNAGAGRWLKITETSSQEASQMIALPYLAAFNLTRELLDDMRKQARGHIVNVTSVASRLAWPGAVGYIAARRAMEGFNAALRADLYGSKIGVTLVVFGTVESSYWDHNPGSRERLPKRAASIRSLTPSAAATALVSSIEKGQRLLVKPAIFRLLFLLNEFLPNQTEAMMCR